MADVFISYAREDASIAEALADVLSDGGWSVWWDWRIAPGENFSQVIENELQAAGAVIVLWSSHSVGSRWVRDEASAAADRNVLVPAVIEPDLDVPLGLRSIQTADLSGFGSGNAHGLSGLLSAVRSLVAPSGLEERSSPHAATRSAKGPRRRFVWQLVIGFVAVCIAIVTLTEGWTLWLRSDTARGPITAVLPFVDHSLDSDPKAAFGKGIQRWLTGALTEARGWNMVTLDHSEQLDRERSLLESGPSLANQIQRLVGGYYFVQADSVFIEAVVVDAATGKVVAASKLGVLVRDARLGMDLLANKIAAAAKSVSSRLQTEESEAPASAFAAYVRGIVELLRGWPGDAHEWFAASFRSGYGPAGTASEVVAPFVEMASPVITILPFWNAGTQLADTLTASQIEPLRWGLAHLLQSSLSRRRLRIVERERIDWILDELALAEVESLSTSVRVGRLLAADLLVEGTFAVLGSDVLVEVHIVDVRSARILKTFDEQRSLQRLSDLSKSLAEQISMMDLPTLADDQLVEQLVTFLETVGLEDEASHWKSQLQWRKGMD